MSNWKASTGAASSCPNGVTSSSCNPPNAIYNASVVQTTDPSWLSGSSGTAGLFQLFSSPAASTVIWGHSLNTSLNARNFIWDFYVYVTSTNYTASELDLYKTLSNGKRFMMGSQCNRAANTWDTWNEAKQTSIQNFTIACNSILTANSWHRVTFYNTVYASGSIDTYTYHVTRVDGVDYVLNQSQPAGFVGWPEGLIGVQVQLDNNFTPKGATVPGVKEFIENMHVYSW